MDSIDQLRTLPSRTGATKLVVQTMEATENAMVMRFIQILRYNVFNALEVTPELVTDEGRRPEGMNI